MLVKKIFIFIHNNGSGYTTIRRTCEYTCRLVFIINASKAIITDIDNAYLTAVLSYPLRIFISN